MNTIAMKQVLCPVRRVRTRADKDVLRIEAAEVAQEIEKGFVISDVPAASGQGTDEARVVGGLAKGLMEVDERALIITAPAQQLPKRYVR